MALICGEKGHYPCPICLIPWYEQSNLSKTHTLHTAEHTIEIYKTGLDLTAAECEALLKSEGLHNVEVWIIMVTMTIGADRNCIRMCSGQSSFQILTKRCPGITCITMCMV